MTIQIAVDATPNPQAMKFTPDLGRPLVEGRSQTYNSPRDAETSPLARSLFTVPGVVSVFITRSFITVRKAEDTSWDAIVPKVEAALQTCFS